MSEGTTGWGGELWAAADLVTPMAIRVAATMCLVQLLHTVRTGEPAFPRQFGHSFWDDPSADPGRAESFDALMGARLAANAPAIAAAYPWGTLGHVIDVGGGNATLLIAILRVHGDLRGTVMDLAGPVARAEQAIASRRSRRSEPGG